jgi:RIO-like serine/threonine protein kinase
MILIKLNKEKNRSVFFNKTHYVKIWDNISPNWINDHVKLLKEFTPGYVIDYGNNWISYNVITGTLASTVPHSREFVNFIHKSCLDQIKSTSPWYHGDWSLSNIIINNNKIHMIDWDNLDQYKEEEVYIKLNSDLKSAFGDLF